MPIARIWTAEEEAWLKVMWADKGVTMTAMGNKMGIDPQTIRNHATRLSLSPRKTAPWPQRDIDTLRRLHANGYSRAEIARQMPVYSRSAIIGKLERLSLMFNGKTPIILSPRNRAITLVKSVESKERFTYKRECLE